MDALMRIIAAMLIALLATGALCRGDKEMPDEGEGAVGLTVRLPIGVKVKSATAVASGLDLETAGLVDGANVSFEGLLPDTAYEVRLELTDGTVVQGVDMGWYNEEPAAEDAKEITAEDRAQIDDILDLQKFYNKTDVLRIEGDHRRATALVRLVRDTDFYAGAGQVIWRIELWYFENQAGGWAAVSQQNRVLRRERFKTVDEFRKAEGKFVWAPQLGGVRLSADEPARTIELPAEALRRPEKDKAAGRK